jgi:hypothetical protein
MEAKVGGKVGSLLCLCNKLSTRLTYSLEGNKLAVELGVVQREPRGERELWLKPTISVEWLSWSDIQCILEIEPIAFPHRLETIRER